MSLASRISSLSTRIATEIKAVRTEIAGKANTVHNHAAADTNSGTFDIARLPVASSGTSNSTQVVRADDSRLSNSRTPTGTAGGKLSGTYPNPGIVTGGVGSIEVGADIIPSGTTVGGTAGSAAVGTPALRALGTTASTAAAGNDARLSNARTPTAHNHSAADLASGTIDNARLPPRLYDVQQTQVADLNNASESGWYLSASNPTNAPVAGAFFWGVKVDSYYASFIVQTAIVLGGTPTNQFEYRRIGSSGVWTPWYQLWSSLDEGDSRYSAINHGHALTDANITGVLPSAQHFVATESARGGVELATNAETVTGTDTTRAVHPAGLKTAVLAIAYPVGSIYMSVVNTSPATFLGGTWAVWGTGRTPVGVNTGETEFNTVEKTGGAKTHTLTVNEMPSHDHLVGVGWGEFGTNNWKIQNGTGRAFNTAATNVSGGRGAGQAHNNLQPYITCYMWKRTA